MAEPKYDSETLAQLAVIRAQAAADKALKDVEELKMKFLTLNKVTESISDRCADNTKELRRTADQLNELINLSINERLKAIETKIDSSQDTVRAENLLDK